MTHSTDIDAPVEWERFACYCTGSRHYYVREPYGFCPPARVPPPGEDQS